MAVKKLRGEKDEVTIQTIETRQNEVEDDPAEMMERQKRARATERHRRNAQKKADKLRATLGAAYKHGGSRPRGKGSRGPYGERSTLERIAPDGTADSTPTPAQWKDVAQPADEAEDDVVMQDDADDNDNEDDEDEVQDNDGNDEGEGEEDEDEDEDLEHG